MQLLFNCLCLCYFLPIYICICHKLRQLININVERLSLDVALHYLEFAKICGDFCVVSTISMVNVSSVNLTTQLLFPSINMNCATRDLLGTTWNLYFRNSYSFIYFKKVHVNLNPVRSWPDNKLYTTSIYFGRKYFEREAPIAPNINPKLMLGSNIYNAVLNH